MRSLKYIGDVILPITLLQRYVYISNKSKIYYLGTNRRIAQAKDVKQKRKGYRKRAYTKPWLYRLQNSKEALSIK